MMTSKHKVGDLIQFKSRSPSYRDDIGIITAICDLGYAVLTIYWFKDKMYRKYNKSSFLQPHPSLINLSLYP
jgi:hypothetical protein